MHLIRQLSEVMGPPLSTTDPLCLLQQKQSAPLSRQPSAGGPPLTGFSSRGGGTAPVVPHGGRVTLFPGGGRRPARDQVPVRKLLRDILYKANAFGR